MADSLAGRLQQLRTAQAISAMELANRSGVPYAEIVRLESRPRGRVEPEVVRRLASAMQTTPEYLAEGREPDPAALRVGLVRAYGALGPDERERLKYAPIQERLDFVLGYMEQSFPTVLDRRQMAARLGYTPEALTEVLAGMAPLQSHLLKRLANQVGLPVDFFVRGDLFGGADDVRNSDPARIREYYEVVQEAMAAGISPGTLRKAVRILAARDEAEG